MEDTGIRLPNDIAVVVPTYNVGDRLESVVDGLLARVDSIIVVNDGSTDGCVDRVRNRSVRIIDFPHNRGKGHALVAGYRAALEDDRIACVAVVDADGQHDPAELPRLYDALKTRSADVTIGARNFNGRQVPWRSRFGNKLTIALTKWLFGKGVTDTQSGYRLVSRRFLEAELPTITGGRYETEMELLGKALGGPYEVVTVPIQTIYERGNAPSHFHKLRDSALIYWKLFGTAARVRFGARTTT